jgi:hypothetical protein
MSFFDRLHNIEKKYAFTFLGFILAAIFGALSIYTTFYWDRNPQIRYTVNSILGVYDIREEVGKLDIIYDRINIREKKQMLSLITLNVANVGDDHLTKALYDNNDPLGFKLNGGILLKAEISEASNSYLFKNLNISLESKEIVHFSPVIIDSGESYSVKILALHNENEFPEILPLGKIAGVKEIELIPWSKEASKIPFWKEVMSGGIFIHLTRAFSYFFVLILIGLTIGIPTAILSDVASKRKRKRHIRDFKSLSDISFKEEDDFIFESYLNRGEMYLMGIDNLLSSKKRLKIAIDRHLKHREKDGFDEIEYAELRRDYPFEQYPVNFVIPKLLDSGFVTKESAEIAINSHMQNTLKHFLRFLKGRGVNLDRPFRHYVRAPERLIHVDEKTD